MTYRIGDIIRKLRGNQPRFQSQADKVRLLRAFDRAKLEPRKRR